MSYLLPQYRSAVIEYEHQLGDVPEIVASGLLQTPRIEPLEWEAASAAGVRVSVLRLDRLHHTISGNKWFKLKFNLLLAKQAGHQCVMSMGGAWSNHLHALAWAGPLFGLKVKAVIRGEELHSQSNALLRDLHELGVGLEFVSRSRYRQYRMQSPLVDGCAVIPEGGDNLEGVLGATTMIPWKTVAEHGVSQVLMALGTGCSLAGACLSAPLGMRLTGVSALKGQWVSAAFSERMQNRVLSQFSPTNWQIDDLHHGGGFARADDCLLSFIHHFADNTGLNLDPVYTGKAMMALLDRVATGDIPAGSHVLFVHSGGLQGNRGFTNSE